MLGFSIYLGHDLTADDYNYLIMMRNAGFSTIFTSLHIPENDLSLVLSRLGKLTKWCKDLDLSIIADVSKEGLKKLGIDISDIDQIKKLALTGLRIDDGVDFATVAKLSKVMPIALNASTIMEDDIDELKDYNADFDHLQAWHNYYPRPETGLDAAWLKEKNTWLHKSGMQTMAFIAGDAKKRGPIHAGLPTLEKQRDENPLAAMLELKDLECDHIFVGDDDFSKEAADSFTNYAKKDAITLHVDRSIPKLFANEWHNRPDVARDVIRLTEGRIRQVFSTQPQTEVLARPKGTITCDNDRYLRYKGELQITKRDLLPDEKVNVLGHVVRSDLPLLNFIQSKTKMIFE